MVFCRDVDCLNPDKNILIYYFPIKIPSSECIYGTQSYEIKIQFQVNLPTMKSGKHQNIQ